MGEPQPLKGKPELLTDFENKWSDDSPDYPPCARCGEEIGSPDEDEAAMYIGGEGDRDLPIRVWRPHPEDPGERQELAFHKDCARQVGII